MTDSVHETYLGASGSDAPVSETDAVLLSAYLDGELSEDEKIQLEKRLAEEPRLKQEWLQLQAEHKLILAADPTKKQSAEPVSDTFSKFGSKLALALPSALPVAPALRPPRLRRALTIMAGLIFGLILLGALTEKKGSGNRQTWSGWRVAGLEGKVLIYRDGKVLDCKKDRKVNWGDRVELTLNSTLTLYGPSELRCTLSESAIMAWRVDGEMRLESGKAYVRASNRKAIQALKLSTPDGDVLPDLKAQPLEFEVKVENHSGAEGELHE